MQFTLSIKSDNDAFTDAPQEEVFSILDKAAVAVVRGETEGKCLDTNGNTVGEWRMTA